MNYYEYHDVNRRGSIRRVDYTTLRQDGKRIPKYANIYLPFGYNGSDLEKKYDILYVMHGGGGSPDAWMDCCMVKNMLDYTIDTGEVDPLIVVFPSYYKTPREGAPVAETEQAEAEFFQKELMEDLLPAVESVCNTYADHMTAESFHASRMHRGFTGFSMGSANTWYTVMNNLDSFAWFAPLSGDCWSVGPMGGKTHTEETVKRLYDAVKKSGYATDGYFIYTATGTEDKACEALDPQVREMKKYPDAFAFDEDYSKGNFHYLLEEGLKHEYTAVVQYLYNFLPYLFKKGK